MDDIVVAIDPGRDKCGFALVARSGRLLGKGIAPTADIATAVGRFVPLHQVSAFAIGDGTAGAAVKDRLLAAGADEGTLFEVDERHSSEIGRRHYWKENPPRGWRRLLPVGMLVPPKPYDDLVAVELARRFLNPSAGVDTRSS